MRLGIDTHCDILYTTVKNRDWSLQRLRQSWQWDPKKALRAGLTLQTCAIYTAPWRKDPHEAVKVGLQMAGIFRRIVEAFPETLRVTESAQIRDAHRRRKLGLMLSIEGAECLGGDLDVLRAYAALGLRILGLAWNPPNPFAMGCHGDPKAPLTPLGRKAVRLANDLGIVLDVSHLNEGGFWDLHERSTAPFIATHSNARALCEHKRNLTDRQLKAIARRGGVVGAVFYTGFVRPGGPATIADLVAHIDHMVQVMGIDHVGIGADYEGMNQPVAGLEDVGCLPRLFDALSARYGNREIAKIAGLNFLRVFEQVF